MADYNEHFCNIILEAVKGLKESLEVNDPVCVKGYRSILNSIIRQYHIPRENYLISKDAYDYWKKLTDADINNFFYTETIPLKAEAINSSHTIYPGSRKDGIVVDGKDGLKFNDLFVCDHVVPVVRFIELFESREDLDYRFVRETLDSMRICRILKKEDRSLRSRTKGRTIDFEQVIRDIYQAHGVNIYQP